MGSLIDGDVLLKNIGKNNNFVFVVVVVVVVVVAVAVFCCL